ncbi:CTTNBP2 N-terminal-like protein isoform X2 [Eupeodes corollae]|uniref:CTTNBP2 N-terminal-like protein isoform X2 n=1 Tax=Eupeodes corollae TaxID=290404 RepID=UPI00248F85D3|nr:CTTNBP2 N-terminal-like protein isoform X2 [Eupeodes corollae]
MAGAQNSSDSVKAERELSNSSCDNSLHSYDSDKNDPFGNENTHGTARYVGVVGCSSGDLGGVGGNMGGTSGLASKFDFLTMKAANNQKSSRTDMPRSELIKMLVYLEGELQAREVVIAALRNERVKHFITHLRSNPIQHTDPHAALFRDKIALGGNLISRQSSTAAVQADMEVRVIIEQQMESLYQMVHKQRATHVRMVSILTDSLDNNQRMLQELEEEKRKHEHDTAQGDDITYGLEMERTKLKQELEAERTQSKKLEKDIKKLQETLEFERGRQKQIVLLLIAERKKILMKYTEEGKRSEDLAQILSEEKQRSDSLAEGLEEESKKSLRMEAELEKQSKSFENERKTMRLALVKEEKRIKELETEVALLKGENEVLKKTNILPQRMQTIQSVPVPNVSAKSKTLGAKIVQPTATVSSVPVSGPTTGIARSISSSQTLRAANVIIIEDSNTGSTQQPPPKQGTTTSVLGVLPPVSHRTPLASVTSSSVQLTQSIQQQQQSPQQQQLHTITSPILAAAMANATCSIQATAHNPGASAVTPLITGQPAASQNLVAVPINNIIASVTVAPLPISSSAIVGTRGVPPPIPPNKPVVPPKREPSISRTGSLAANNSK